MKASILAALSEYATEALALATDSTTRTVLAGVISDLDAEHDRLVEDEPACKCPCGPCERVPCVFGMADAITTDEPEQDYYPLGAAAR